MHAHNNLFEIFVVPLNQSGIKYMITGSVASIMYGEPRLTHDIDLVIFLIDKDVEKLRLLFPEENFYTPPEEVVRIEMSRSLRGHFNIIHHTTGYKADIYLMGNDPLQIWGFKNRRQLKLGDELIWIAPPEYVVVKKMAYWEEGKHEKHIGDIKAMLQIQGDNISIKEIQSKLTSSVQKAKFETLLI